MLKKLTVAIAALALVGAVLTPEALARGGGGGHGGGHFGGGGGFRGGYGGYGYGALGLGLGVGLGWGYYGYPYSYGYPYAYNGYYGDGCYLVRHRVWTPFGWRFQAYRTYG